MPSVDSTGGTIWGFVLLFEIIPSVESTGGTVWAFCIVVIVGILGVLGKHESLEICTQFC
jgi:hypothetical protein